MFHIPLRCTAMHYFNVLKYRSTSNALQAFVLLLLVVVTYELRFWSDLQCHYMF